MVRSRWMTLLVLASLTATLLAACGPSVDELRDAGDVEGLIVMLEQAPDAERRSDAAVALGQLGEEDASASLMTALDDDEPVVRAAAATALGDLGDVAALEALLAASFDEDARVGDDATNAIDEILWSVSETRAVEALVRALDADDPLIRQGAEDDLELFLDSLDPRAAGEAVVAADADDAWLAVALRTTEAELATETWLLGLQVEPLEDIHAAVADADEDDDLAVTEASSYDEDSDAFHPAIVLEETSPWADSASWAPTALRFLELVIIVDDVEWELQENCGTYYDDSNEAVGEVTRHRGEQEVRIVAAHDGELVDERTVEGGDARACESEEMWTGWEEDDGEKKIRGEAPDLEELVDWIESLTNLPDR